MMLCQMVMNNDFEPSYTNEVHTVNEQLPAPEALEWNVDYSMLDRLELAIETIDDAVSNLELRLYQFTEFGKNVPKKYKCSPDAFFQVRLFVVFNDMRELH